MPRPCDVARNWRQIARDGGVLLALLINILNLLKLRAVVHENDIELRLQVTLERIALENALEAAEHLERPVNGSDGLERHVNERLQVLLQLANLYVELNIVTVKFVVLKVQKVVALALEILDDLPETSCDELHALQLAVG